MLLTSHGVQKDTYTWFPTHTHIHTTHRRMRTRAPTPFSLLYPYVDPQDPTRSFSLSLSRRKETSAKTVVQTKACEQSAVRAPRHSTRHALLSIFLQTFCCVNGPTQAILPASRIPEMKAPATVAGCDRHVASPAHRRVPSQSGSANVS